MAQISGHVKRQILVAGDGKTFVRFMNVLLVRMGFEVISAENGDEALRLARLFRPDVMVVDMDMLAADCMQGLSWIRQDKSLAEIPVLIITAGEHESLKKKYMSLAFTRVLAKPVNLSELNKALQTCLSLPQGWARKHLRAGCDQRVTVRHDETEGVYLAQTISDHGIFVAAPAPLRIATEVLVTLRVGGKSISPKGRVIYIKPPGMAIEFTRLSEDEQAELEKFVSNLLAGDIAPLQEARPLHP
jgi:two-component system cell cycle response regulator DivK